LYRYSVLGNREEQHIQPIRNKEKWKKGSYWSKSSWNGASENYKLASVNTSRLPKKK
jgi:hypothetical protein